MNFRLDPASSWCTASKLLVVYPVNYFLRVSINKAFWKEYEGSADYLNEYYYEMPEAAALIWYNATEERMKRDQCFGYCNNHTSMCFDLNEEQYCSSCLHNTQGQSCNHCRDGFYRNPDRDSIGFEDSCIPV